jgi:hypothetical protein
VDAMPFTSEGWPRRVATAGAMMAVGAGANDHRRRTESVSAHPRAERALESYAKLNFRPVRQRFAAASETACSAESARIAECPGVFSTLRPLSSSSCPHK